MVWLLNSQGMKNCKSGESFCHNILAIYTNDWSAFSFVYCCYVYFFSGKFLYVWKPRTITYSLWLPGPLGLTFYESGLACLPGWLGIMNAGWLCSMRSGIFLQMKFIIFLVCPTKLPFFWAPCSIWSAHYLATLDHEITLNILECILNSIEEVKTGFSFALMCMFL